jgi:DNA-binding transcriptional LysR family regulator
VELISRSPRGISLTRAGRELVRTGTPVTSSYENMILRMKLLQDEYLNHLHVGVIPAVMFPAVMRATMASRSKLPNLVVKLHDLAPSMQIKALDSRQIDLALPGHVSEDHLALYDATLLAEIPLLAALPEGHRLCQRQKVDLAELSRDEFVVATDRTYPGRSDYVREACLSAGFEPRCTDHANGPSALLNAVATGRLVGLFPALLLEMAHPGVVFRPLVQKELKVKSYALSRMDETRPFIRPFVNELRVGCLEEYAKYSNDDFQTKESRESPARSR